MKLYIKQKVFSWGDKFTVKDETGRDKYTVEGEVFSWGKKLHVYDMTGTEVAFIKQEVWSWMPRFYVFCGNRQVAEIKKEFTFFFPKYSIVGLGWEIDGSFLAHEYQITQGGRQIVSISKEWMTWGDSYELDIRNPADELVALSVVLTIDCVTASSSSASVSVSSN
ncbi:MAG: LURP-one-related family protein [Oscillospiraceae bacterium]|nr:LURP-one-related family protein [Oscillospiraceae bacterium]